jgi:hypothetical protein
VRRIGFPQAATRLGHAIAADRRQPVPLRGKIGGDVGRIAG